MSKISRISQIAFIIFLIVGSYFLIIGLAGRVELALLDYDSLLNRGFDLWWEMFYTSLFILSGTIIIILTVIGGFYFYLKSPPKLEVKKDYIKVNWLNHQYYELGKSLQDIADNQGVSMITVKKWVDKLDGASVDVGVKE